MVMEAVAARQDDGNPDDPDTSAGSQLSIADFVKPGDWLEGKNRGSLCIDICCTLAYLTYSTDLKLLNQARESTERIIDDLCEQSLDLSKHRPRYDRGKARANLLRVANPKNSASSQDKRHELTQARLPTEES